MVIIAAAFLYILLLQVDDVSAQTSCVISPDLDTLIIANGLGRDVEFHCQCMDSNGMIITGTRWFFSNGTAAPTQNVNIPPAVLYIGRPFDCSDAATYICSPTNGVYDPSRDLITLSTGGPFGQMRTCTIYSPSATTDDGIMHIPSGTQNVILYCICRRTNTAVGPTFWFIGGTEVTRTTASGDNPYYRDNVPSPLIIPSFTATHAGTYGCASVSRHGNNPTSPSVTIDLTISATRPPTNVRATVLTPRSVEVTWTISSTPDVTGYIISYTTTASYTSGGSVTVNQRATTRGTLNNLEESTTYTITVQATSNSGNANSNAVSVTTYTDVPISPPQNVMVTSVNRASLMVSWQPPLEINHNGMITGYTIQYTRTNVNNMMSVNVNSGTTHTISGLAAYVNYAVIAAARNVNGTGPFSNPPVVQRSGEDVPTAPRSLMIINVTDTTVTLSWMSPDPPNGIITNYRVQYRRSDSSSYTSIDTRTTDLTYTVTGLMTGTEYDFRVRVDNGAGHSDPSNVVTAFVGIPVITTHPMGTVILLFTNFTNHTLTCEADGALSYRWERQNDVIPSDSTGVNTNTLTLINLQPEDAGNYRCVATNIRGSSKSNYATVTLSIHAPRVITHPTATGAAAPFSALFSCSIQVYGYPTITWYRNNNDPVPSKAYSMVVQSMDETTSILTIPNVTSEDVDTYYCEALANRTTVISLNANLFLADPPSPPVVMIDPVVNLTVNNYNLTIKCLPNKDNFSYKWIKKNNVLPSRAQGVNTSQLTIVNLKPEDSGDYQCVMSNSTGTISSNFSAIKITVSIPTILEQPNNMSKNVYKSVSFKCTAHGFGILKVFWKRVKHHMPVTAEVTEERSLNKITSILKITKTAGYYGGQYYCVAENEVGKVVSQIANLHVQAPRPEMIICPENVTVRPNHSFAMNCLALSFGLLKYDWSKRDGILPQTAVQSCVHNILFDPYRDQTTSVYNLAVYNVQPSDEGWYCCVATNEAGSTVYCAWLEVNTLANITTQPLPATFKVGDVNVIAMSCSAVGMGPIYYQWEKYNSSNNSWISPSHRVVDIGSPYLKFNVISEEDEGVYRCVVTNDDGSVTSDNATVHVYGLPIIKFISNDTMSPEGDKVNLICSAVNDIDVDAIHPLQIYWYKGNNLVTPNGRHIILYNETDNASRQLNSTLLLDPVNRTDDGVYTCRAFNHNDSFSESKTTLTVQYPPFLLIANESPYMTNVGSLVILYCRGIGKPIPQVQWYKDDTTVNPISSSFQQTFIVPTNIPHTTVYTCKGINYIENVKYTRSASITVIVKAIQPCLPLLDAPVNGKITTIEADGITKHIIFSCNSNYVLKGVSFATCIDGMWSSSTPTCTKL